jgi:hypothetical protein
VSGNKWSSTMSSAARGDHSIAWFEYFPSIMREYVKNGHGSYMNE